MTESMVYSVCGCMLSMQMSRSIVIALFNVNTPEFYSILSALPRSVLVISCFIYHTQHSVWALSL